MTTQEIPTEPALHSVPLAADPGPVPELEPTTVEPVPMMAGTFALYDDGHGGIVLVTDVNGEITKKAIPAALVKLATGDGMMARQMQRLMGG